MWSTSPFQFHFFWWWAWPGYTQGLQLALHRSLLYGCAKNWTQVSCKKGKCLIPILSLCPPPSYFVWLLATLELLGAHVWFCARNHSWLRGQLVYWVCLGINGYVAHLYVLFVKYQLNSTIFFLLFVGTHHWVHILLLALCPRITPGGEWVTKWDAEDKTQVGHRQGTLLLILPSSLFCE